MESDVSFVLPSLCAGEFWRVSTEPRGLGKSPAATAAFLSELLEAVPLLLPGAAYQEVLLGLLARFAPRGASVFDYQIAAVCIDRGVGEIWTFDRRFPRVDGLRVVDPSR